MSLDIGHLTSSPSPRRMFWVSWPWWFLKQKQSSSTRNLSFREKLVHHMKPRQVNSESAVRRRRKKQICPVTILHEAFFSSVACSQLLSYTPQLGYSAMMQWCPLRGIDSNKLQWKTRRRHPTLPAHRPIHTQQCWPLQSGLPDVRLLLGSPRYDKNSLAKWGHGWWWDALHRWLSARQCA